MSMLLLCTSCLGSFSAFNNLKDWNMEISDSKFVNNLVFWALNIVPVYGLFFLGDTLIFNVIEFWSGSNPIAMNDGEVETQLLKRNASTYEMIASKNRFVINVIEGDHKGNHLEMLYKTHHLQNLFLNHPKKQQPLEKDLPLQEYCNF